MTSWAALQSENFPVCGKSLSATRYRLKASGFALPNPHAAFPHSHSMVPGGLEVTS